MKRFFFAFLLLTACSPYRPSPYDPVQHNCRCRCCHSVNYPEFHTYDEADRAYEAADRHHLDINEMP